MTSQTKNDIFIDGQYAAQVKCQQEVEEQQVLIPKRYNWQKVLAVALAILLVAGAAALGIGLFFHWPIVAIVGGAALAFTLAYFGTDILRAAAAGVQRLGSRISG